MYSSASSCLRHMGSMAFMRRAHPGVDEPLHDRDLGDKAGLLALKHYHQHLSLPVDVIEDRQHDGGSGLAAQRSDKFTVRSTA